MRDGVDVGWLLGVLSRPGLGEALGSDSEGEYSTVVSREVSTEGLFIILMFSVFGRWGEVDVRSGNVCCEQARTVSSLRALL